MDFKYGLYNIKSSDSKDSIPQSPAQNEVWIKFFGVVSKAYLNAANFNKTIRLRFNTSDLKGIPIGWYEPLKVPFAYLLNVTPGIITSSSGNSKAIPGTFLLAVPTLPNNTDFQSIANGEFTRTSIVDDPNKNYRLLVPPESIINYNVPNEPPKNNPNTQSSIPVNNNGHGTARRYNMVNSNSKDMWDRNI